MVISHDQPCRLPVSRLAAKKSPIIVDMGKGNLAVVARAVAVGRTMNPGDRKEKKKKQIVDTMPWGVVCWPCGNMGHARPMCAERPVPN